MSLERALLNQDSIIDLASRCLFTDLLQSISSDDYYSIAATLLSSPVFPFIDPTGQAALLRCFAGGAMNLPIEQGGILAQMLAGRASQYFEKAPDDFSAARQVYEAMRSLFCTCVTDGSSAQLFDSGVVRPFSAWLRRHYPKSHDAEVGAAGRRSRPLVCYLIQNPDLTRGQARTRVFAPVFAGHCRDGRHEVGIYALGEMDEAFVAYVQELGLRLFRHFDLSDDPLQTARSIQNALADDRVDVLFSDLNSALASYLVETRSAPVQMWMDTGQPYWSLSELDWTVMGFDHQHYFGVDLRKSGLINMGLDARLMGWQAAPEAVSRVRASFPADSVIVGCFCRLHKISREWLEMALGILRGSSRAHVVLTGAGNPQPIRDFIERHGLESRFTLIAEMVDIAVWGRAIDIYLDTYPWLGGLVGRELAYYGKPVVGVFTPVYASYLKGHRDPQLTARHPQEAVAMALRLIDDPGFRQTCSNVSLSLAQSFTDVSMGIDELVATIDRLLQEKRCL